MRYSSVLLIACNLLMAGVVNGHSGATGVVKQRMDAMQAMSNRTQVVTDMFKGRAQFDRDAIVKAADSFVTHGSQMLELFPDTEHSRTGSQTEALPEIWLNRDGFNQKAEEFVVLSKALKVTAAATDNERELRTAFFRATKGCSGCHKIYRRPSD